MTSPQDQPAEPARDPFATLFDIRSFTGALFLIFGVIVTIVGLNASDADIEKAAGINLSLVIGLVMLITGIIFIGWLLLSPPVPVESHEMTEDDLPEQMRHHGFEAVPEHPTPKRRSGPPGH
jgi:hypothetical protein